MAELSKNDNDNSKQVQENMISNFEAKDDIQVELHGICYCGTKFYNFLTRDRFHVSVESLVTALFYDEVSIFISCLREQPISNLKVSCWQQVDTFTSSRRVDYSVLIKRPLFSKHKMAVVEYQIFRSDQSAYSFESTIIYPGEREKQDCFHRIVLVAESQDLTSVNSWFHNHHHDKHSIGIVNNCTEVLTGLHRSMQHQLGNMAAKTEFEPRAITEATLYTGNSQVLFEKKLPVPPSRGITQRLKSSTAKHLGLSKSSEKHFSFSKMVKIRGVVERTFPLMNYLLSKAENKSTQKPDTEKQEPVVAFVPPIGSRHAFVLNFLPNSESQGNIVDTFDDTKVHRRIKSYKSEDSIQQLPKFKSIRSAESLCQANYSSLKRSISRPTTVQTSDSVSDPYPEATPEKNGENEDKQAETPVLEYSSIEEDDGYPCVHLPCWYTISSDCDCKCTIHELTGISGLTMLYFFQFTMSVGYFVLDNFATFIITTLREYIL